jgi:CheY-like chemotaxis protein
MAVKVCLLIDDDKEDQLFFAEALGKINGEVKLVIAEDASSAMAILREGTPPDYVFLDLFLPGIDGYEFLLHLKRDIKHRRIPVIIYSRLNDPSQAAKSKKLGASDYLSKTYDVYELKELLKKYIAPEGI